MTNLFLATIKTALIASVSSMITYKIMRLWNEKGDQFLLSLHSHLTNLIMEEESTLLDPSPEPFFGLPNIEETKVILAVDDEGKSFWSKFDNGEWEILQSYIKESDRPAEEIIAEVMEDRLEEGKVGFGNPIWESLGIDTDDPDE